MNQKPGLRFSKLPDDGDPWAPINLLTPEQKKKHQLDPGGRLIVLFYSKMFLPKYPVF